MTNQIYKLEVMESLRSGLSGGATGRAVHKH